MTIEEKKPEQDSPIERDNEWLRHLSPNELASLGINYVAYVKPITVDGVRAFGIYGADGQQLGVSPRRDHALEAIRENDLEPLSLH